MDKKEKNPVFRKAIVPWYDTDPVCFILITFLFLIFLFGMAGVYKAGGHTELSGVIWVPLFLVISSFFAILSMVFRLVKRYRMDRAKESIEFDLDTSYKQE